MDAAKNERQKKEQELLLMAQSVDAARTKQRVAEREAEDMHGEANEARRQAFEIQRQLDALESERSRSTADALRHRAAAEAEAEAKTAALSEVEALRRQLAEAERRAAPSTVVSEANANALALYRQGRRRPITFARSLDSSNHVRLLARLVQSRSLVCSTGWLTAGTHVLPLIRFSYLVGMRGE